MEENKEKTTEELLKENNELLKVLIGKLSIIRTAAWMFVIGVAISILVYLIVAINSCNGAWNSYNNYTQQEGSELVDSVLVVDSVAVDDTTDIDAY